MKTFSIGDLAERAGVAEGTLRMWERRHGFPAPGRLPSGHRRYSERDVELVRQVAGERSAGISLAAAVARAVREHEPPAASLYATLRRRRPHLEPRTLSKRMMVALSHAIEEESLCRAERPLLFASFQRERFYRQEEARWAELSRDAASTVVFADFDALRVGGSAPAEIPVAPQAPFAREWALVCDGGGHGVCLAGWEPTSSAVGPERERYFESIWSVEPEVVREAARVCAEITGGPAPELAEQMRPRLDDRPAVAAQDQLRLATAITNRTLSALA